MREDLTAGNFKKTVHEMLEMIHGWKLQDKKRRKFDLKGYELDMSYQPKQQILNNVVGGLNKDAALQGAGCGL